MGRKGGRRKTSLEYFTAPLFGLIEMTVGTLVTGTLEDAKDPLLFELLVTSSFFFFFCQVTLLLFFPLGQGNFHSSCEWKSEVMFSIRSPPWESHCLLLVIFLVFRMYKI